MEKCLMGEGTRLMSKHIFLTGEIGCGKSTALHRTLSLLPGVNAQGLQTYYPEPRGGEKTLYMRPWGAAEQGIFLAKLPGCDMAHIASVFNALGAALLERAQQDAQVIVIDEIGRLERDAAQYHEALLQCIEGDVPMLCAIRKLKAPWADWIRSHPRVELIEVTQENRDAIPVQLAVRLKEQLWGQ